MDEFGAEASVLVAVVTRPRDLERARQEGWYRIPLRHAPQPLAADLLAFYLTAAFGPERWSVRWIAPVERYQLLTRRELLPDEPAHPRADERYYRLSLGAVRPLLRPLASRRLRRVVFIPTTLGQLLRAGDVNELWQPPERAHQRTAAIWGAGIGTTRRRN